MNALIFSGGAYDGIPDDVNVDSYSLVIAADKGYAYAKEEGILPHIFVGDLDSFSDKTEIKCSETYFLPTEKDKTDTQFAIELAISSGAENITVLGALGGRLDHTLANVHLLKMGLEKGAFVTLCDKTQTVMLINRPTKIKRKEAFALSLIPLTRCEHVSVKGVYYPLSDAVMDLGNPYGVSNEFTEEYAEIDPGTGILVVLISRK